MNPPPRAPAYDSREPERSRPIEDDAALVARMAAGDQQALGILYDRWVDSVHTLAHHVLGDADEAEDVLEETFWQAWRQAARYERSRGAVSTWLSTIARSRALDHLRARQRRAEEPLEGVNPAAAEEDARAAALSSAMDPHRAAEASERTRDVAAALTRLPAEQREVIELAYFGGLSQSEIAERTALPLGTVKTRARLALEKLRSPLARHAEGTP